MNEATKLKHDFVIFRKLCFKEIVKSIRGLTLASLTSHKLLPILITDKLYSLDRQKTSRQKQILYTLKLHDLP